MIGSTVKIDIIEKPILFPYRKMDIFSFISKGFDRSAEIKNVKSISISDTIIEKFVALIVRLSKYIMDLKEGNSAELDKFDHRLIRHLYDLYYIWQ